MDPIAIVMMIIAMVIVWGGMVAAIVHLMRNPDDVSGDLARTERGGDGWVAEPTSTSTSEST